MQNIVNLLMKLPNLSDPELKIKEQYIFEDLLYKLENRRKIFVPFTAISDIISKYHGGRYAGHPGIAETQKAMKENFTWSTLSKDIVESVRSCCNCQQQQFCARYPKAPLHLREPQSSVTGGLQVVFFCFLFVFFFYIPVYFV